ncbi:MAG: aminopeptidase [Clostridia bacterium]|nr:aminopeptidase [Clostridia bacterium]MBR3325680.1 aminopeptidase [Clostridia bacterium]MBR3325689.1 aminopeptidase [Clostridia bacterium]
MSNLLKESKSGWENITDESKTVICKFSDEYIEFLNKSKTEREIVANATEIAKQNGFKEINEYSELHPGDKVYYVNRGKNLYMAVIGNKDIEEGINIIGAHADSPRLDLKPSPLYEQKELAYFNTHYYGGIKKYQWTTIPLAIHGVIVKPSGEKIQVSIGENENEPVFVITDLLPHLGREQAQKKLSEAIEGENLDLLIGSIPDSEEDKKCKEKVKKNIMKILNQKYGITEEDFASSELEVVPAFKARTLGLDESMVAGYGQDDKVCVYASLRAILEVQNPERTAICLFSDKEEIGSMGNTGMQSNVFDTFVSELLNKLMVNRPNLLDKVFCNSRMLSADVDAAVDPLYASVSDPTNDGVLGHGISINKYTGSGGKYNASDANAEYVALIRRIFNENNIKYQFSELGKVDAGGGGTIAYILANKGVDVIDCGVPVLSMHSPYEVTSKTDIYNGYNAYKAFFNN